MSKMMPLQVLAAVTPEEVTRFDELLQDEHYLHAGQPVGDYLRQVIVRDGQWVGLLAWGACSYALQARDEWVGWNAPLRAARQKLLVQNRRFLIPGKARQPNIASQILAIAVTILPQQWVDRFGYAPVFQVRDNRRKLRALAEARATATPFLPSKKRKSQQVPASPSNSNACRRTP